MGEIAKKNYFGEYFEGEKGHARSRIGKICIFLHNWILFMDFCFVHLLRFFGLLVSFDFDTLSITPDHFR